MNKTCTFRATDHISSVGAIVPVCRQTAIATTVVGCRVAINERINSGREVDVIVHHDVCTVVIGQQDSTR